MIASNEALKTRRAKKDDSLPDYKIFETNEFINCLESLPRKDKSKIEKKLTYFVYPQLKKEPHYGINIKKLHGYNPGTWRYRIGNYRIFYIIEKQIINIISIDHRKDAYK
jgi:mRNA interferase RelE/StbE